MTVGTRSTASVISHLVWDEVELVPTGRQLLIRRALELDDPPLRDETVTLVKSRLAALRGAPASAVSLEEMKARQSK
jgi:hypothetical protein